MSNVVDVDAVLGAGESEGASPSPPPPSSPSPASSAVDMTPMQNEPALLSTSTDHTQPYALRRRPRPLSKDDGQESASAQPLPVSSASAVPAPVPASPVSTSSLQRTGTGFRDPLRRGKPPSPEARRQRLLKAAGNEPDFGRQNLHRLFRLLDADNDGLITHNEFQSGLVAMGLSVAKDAMAVARLSNEIDHESTGGIEEDAFIAYFWQLKKKDLEANLRVWQGEEAEDVEVVFFDPTDNSCGSQTIGPKDLGHFLDETFGTNQKKGQKRYWFIVKGYHEQIMSLLGIHFDVHEEMYQDVVTLQRDKIEVVGEKPCGQLLISAYSIRNSPFQSGHRHAVPRMETSTANAPEHHLSPVEQIEQRNWFDRLFAFPAHLLGRQSALVSRSTLDLRPPTLIAKPVSLIVVSDSILITVARDAPQQGGEESPIFRVIDELRDQIFQRFPDVITADAKYLAYLFTEAVTELNFDVRDLLKNWLDLIDDGISQTPHPAYRAHLFEFAKISAVYTKEMLALTNQLKKQDWDDRNNAISRYFAEQSVYFRDLTDQLHTITEETEEMNSMTQNLFTLYRSIQDEQQNRVLLLLTLITSIFVPAQFLTGLWGMNFTNMPELTWRYGYVMFWVLVVVLLVVVTLVFRLTGFWQLSGMA